MGLVMRLFAGLHDIGLSWVGLPISYSHGQAINLAAKIFARRNLKIELQTPPEGGTTSAT
ncbi:MAG: hypothetical protein NTX50_05315 [Candidatus Sumerlaeota bacterium]|nr:hypothetical protein [Candidatus Sumerlaeota bacterium]